MTETATRSDPTQSRGTSSHPSRGHGPRSKKELAWLSLGALGVVYGDIGTSPLYAMRECLTNSTEHVTVAPTHENVLGVVSLFFWALTLVVVIKYLIFIMRADNRGEGGILALAALIDKKNVSRVRLAVPIMLALFVAGL
ncbi:MAG: Kup system potassium uptake protein, partial [Myxococcales bacterium]|nr:Kup system potassium uptake protein [Myxococcales bacterium]